MNTTKMLVLTKSIKRKNYCVAGIDLNTGNFMRLVSEDAESHGALSKNQVKYFGSNGTEYEIVPLDVVDVQFLEQQVLYHQTENYLVGDRPIISKIKRISLQELITYLSPKDKNELFSNSRNRISFEEAKKIHHSLEVILADNVSVYRPDLAEKGTSKIKADFFSGSAYFKEFSVTDPKVKAGDRFQHAVLVVSIAEKSFPYGYYYKFIAKVFPL